MAATPHGLAPALSHSHTHVSNQHHSQHYHQQLSGSYLQSLGVYNGGHSLAPRKVLSYDPLPMNVAPGAYQGVSAEMDTLLVATRHESQSKTTSSGKAKKKAKSGGKRSREELNRREQERVQLLNDRILQIKEQLEEAGVKPKKTKQSVLDNAACYIERLQGDLVIAQQTAELAEKKVANAHKTTPRDSDSVYERCFQQSSMPRMIVDVNMKPLAVNTAFMQHSGHDSNYLMKKTQARKYLTKEKGKLEMIVKTICEKAKPLAVATTAVSCQGDLNVLLSASPVCDVDGKPAKIEFSLVPLDATVNDGEAATTGGSGDAEEALSC